MSDKKGRILYIGKAKSLRARLGSYRIATPKTAPEHILEMIESVSTIRWEEHRSENEALLREGELIRAVRPPFNIAGNWPAMYFFIGICFENEKLSFRLTSFDVADGYRLFGCYKHRHKTKLAYGALLRLIYIAVTRKDRFFGVPAKISRTSPAYLYTLPFPNAWVTELAQFLEGKSSRFLRTLTGAMLENETLPPFMYGSLQKDLTRVRDFYRIGPHATRKLKLKHKLKGRLLSHEQMNTVILDTMS